jgi:uncharacterized protein
LPTRTLGQGLAAAVLFDETKEPNELLEDMQEAADNAVTLEVTTASRSVTINDVAVQEGDFIGLANDTLEVSAKTPEACLQQMLEARAKDYEIAILFYSTAVGEEKAQAFLEELQEQFEDMDIEVQSGAPDLYNYVMALE